MKCVVNCWDYSTKWQDNSGKTAADCMSYCFYIYGALYLFHIALLPQPLPDSKERSLLHISRGVNLPKAILTSCSGKILVNLISKIFITWSWWYSEMSPYYLERSEEFQEIRLEHKVRVEIPKNYYGKFVLFS